MNLQLLLKNLEPIHKKHLQWFVDFKDTNIFWKDIHNRDFANSPKGIFVPKDQPYALAIKKTLSDDYSQVDFSEPYTNSLGGWYFEYAPEKNKDGINYYTNSALIYCSTNLIPIGVITQTHNKHSNINKYSSYKIWGLGYVKYESNENIFRIFGFDNDNQIKHKFV